MMAELRLILLGAGVLIILGIWAWGRWSTYRANRAAAAAAAAALAAEQGYTDAEPADGDERFGPARDAPLPFDADDEYADTTVLSPADIRRPPIDPPIITISDLPDDVNQVELSTPPAAAPAVPVLDTPRPAPPVLEPLGKIMASGARPGMRPTPPPRNAMPWPPPSTTPTPTKTATAEPTPEAAAVVPPPAAPARPVPPASEPRVARPAPPPVVEPARVAPPDPAPAPAAAPSPTVAPANDTKPDRQQRIIAVRLVMLSGRLASGEQLVQAFRAEQLDYGRYRIFHRMVDGDRPLFSVASLVEPGSFDPDTMATERYLGVSLFAVFPGPRPAPEAFDELIATGRRLANRLGAALQDDMGQSLTGARLIALREELVNFESALSATRSGRRPD